MYFPCLLVLDRSQVTRSYAVNEPSSFPSLQKILIRLWVYDSSLAHLAQVQPASFLRGKDSIFPVFKCKQTRKKNIECKIILHTVICSTGGMLQRGTSYAIQTQTILIREDVMSSLQVPNAVKCRQEQEIQTKSICASAKFPTQIPIFVAPNFKVDIPFCVARYERVPKR
jgi:hypothetical protein